MKKLKNILIVLFSVCAIAATVCLCAACNDDSPQSEYPDYRPTQSVVPPTEDGDDDDDGTFSGRYVISVKSVGGLSMSGVRVSLLNSLREEVVAGISINGTVVLSATPGVYTVSVDEASLPMGYHAPTEAIVTSAVSGAVEIVLTSQVTTETKAAYAQGDIMFDFTLTDSETNEVLQLSSLLSGDDAYSAVVLNFFYINCSPCRSELPAMQQAYTQYSDRVKLISLSPYDSASSISAFKQGLPPVNFSTRITFNMCVDPYEGYMSELFAVDSYPTTVVIDRYGMIAYIDSGSMTRAAQWTSMFAYYSSSQYAQSGTNDDADEDEDDTPSTVIDIPNVEMPASDVIAQAVRPETTSDSLNATFYPEQDEEDAIYSWPFLTGEVEGKSYMYPANSVRKDDDSKIHNSYAIIYADVQMEVGDILSFDYWIDVEDGLDYLYFLVDRDIVGRYTGKTESWENSGNVFFATREGTFQIAFVYMKDDEDPDEKIDDIVRVTNIKQTAAENVIEATDVLTAAVSGDERNAQTAYIDVIAPAANDPSGYYKVANTNREQILYVDVLHYTTWALFEGLERSSNTVGVSTASVYSIIIANYASSDNSVYTLNGHDHTDTVVDLYYMQLFSETDYVPVNNAVRALLVDFLIQYGTDNEKTYGENAWLEFCYYFTHYGAEHGEGSDCYETYDPVAGTHWYNAPSVNVDGFYSNGNIIVTDEEDEPTVTHTATVLSQIQTNAGTRYLFTPRTSGVYLIKTDLENSEDGMGPKVGIFTADDKVEIYSTYAPLNYDYFGLGGVDADGDGVFDIESRYEGQVWLYYYFTAGETYCLRLGYFTAGTTGSYDFGMQYLGEEVHVLFHASGLGDGTWTNNFKYTAVTAILDPSSKIWYHDNNSDGTADSMIYVDFIHGNYLDGSRTNSLINMIRNGVFNLSSTGGLDYTEDMMWYYNEATKDVNSETYGLYQATDTLINLIKIMINARLGSDYVGTSSQDTFFWLSTCCYYQEFSATSNYSLSYYSDEE